MAMIRFQPRPKVPPIGFFQPISTDPRDMMTDVEYLLGILKKLNEMIGQINKNSKFIDEYTGKIEEIEAEISNLRQEMTDFEDYITEDINSRFTTIRSELIVLVNQGLAQSKAYTDATANILRNEIRQIALGQITVFDPTTGMLNNLQDTLDNMYGSTRDDALTADEYDSLLLTATEYDGKELTAFDYDRYGKTLLMDTP